MTARRVRYYFLLAVLILVPCFASAATSEFRVLFDADNNPATGCTVGTMSGVDQMFVTQATNAETTAAVVRTHRLICAAGVFGEPVDVSETTWPASIDPATGMMTVETRVPFTAFQASGLPPQMRIGFVATTGSATQSLLTGPTGGVLIFPPDTPGRRRAIDFGDPRTFVLDGHMEDWGIIDALSFRELGSGDNGFQFTRAYAFANSSDQFVYFSFQSRAGTGTGPTANDDDYVRPQGQALSIAVSKGVLKNDVDPNGEPLTATKASEPNHGTVTLNPDGSFVYTPTTPASVEVDHFTYTASNSTTTSNTATVTIEVNDKPKLKNGTLTVAENVPNGTVVGVVDVQDQAGDAHTFSITSGNTGGAFAITALPNGDGQISVANRNAVNFEVNPVFTLTVKVTDEGGLSDSGTITINVTNVNDAPTVQNDSRSVAEDQILTVPAPGLYALASDEDGNPMTLSIVSNAAHGVVTLNPDGSWSYDSDPNYNGPDSFTWRAHDGTTFSSTATVNLTVTPVNDAPTFTGGGNVSSPEDTPYNAAWATGISAGPADEVGQTLNFTVVAATPSLFLVQPAIDPVTGNLSYTPAANANGSTSVDVTLVDNGGGANSSGTVTFTITITPVNDTPSFVKGPDQSVSEDAGPQTVLNWATAISAGPADESGQMLTFNVTGNSNAALFLVAPSVASDGTLTYTPAANAFDSAIITITLSDDGAPVATSGAQSFTITVNAANDAPVNTVPVAPQLTNEDTPLTFTVGGGNGIQIADIDAGTGSLQVTLAATNGTLTADTGATINNNNTATVTLTGTLANINASLDGLIFTPVTNYAGSAQITVTTNDQGNTGSGGAQQDVDLVAITVTGVNDQPSVNAATFTLDENSVNGTAVGTVTFSDPDAADTHTFAISAGNTGGAFAINATTGAITVANSAALDFETTPTFTLTVDVTDNSGSGNATGSGTITVNLNNVNEAPVANDATFNVDENSANGTGVGTVTATDQDAGQTLSYAITAGNTGGAFAINASSGAITVANIAALNFETNPTFSLTVTVTDNGTGNLSDTAAITINLNNVNEAPVVNAATVNLNENSANGTSVHTVTFTEPDTTGQTHTFAITGGNSLGAFAINASTGEITVADVSDINFEVNPTFTLTVQVTDAGAPTPPLSGSASITINLTNVNDAPVVNDQTFAVNENSANGTVVGTVVASDEDAGQTLTYSITGGNALGAFAINASSGQITVADVTDLDFETNPTFSLTVQVMDNGTGNLTDTATITINLNNINEAPALVAALAPANVTENSPNGTVVTTVTANDPDSGQTLTFSITGGNTGGAFAINAASGQITVANSAAVNFEANPNFSLTVQVTDNGTPAASDTEVYLINVNNVNEAPVVTPATFSLNENSPNGTSVGTVTFTEPDGPGQTHTFAITAGNTGGAFAINSGTGAITVANVAAIDFETNPTFALTVEVTDNGVPIQAGSATITINLLDANEAPVVNDQIFAVDENSAIGTVVGSVVFSDPDGPTDTFSIIAGNAGGEFALNSSTGQITVAGALNYEAATSYSFTVQVTDNGTPVGSDTAVITININNLNEAPVVTPATFGINENSANGTTVGTVSYTDPDAGQTHTYSITGGNTGGAFAINASTGQITVANSAAVNFEVTPSFSLTVQVADNGTPVLNGTATITINLTNVNDAPVVNDQTFNVNENVANGTVVGTVAASDEDAGQTLTYSITAGNTGSAFAINPSTGQITVANPINYETLSSYSLTVQVQDNGAGLLTDTATITINVNNLNEAPSVTPATFNVNENVANGTVVGTVSASDPDAGQTLTYAITAGNTGGAFAINPGTGQITVANSINYEALASYSLTVQVTDNGAPNLSGSATITINVIDANENPVVTPATFTLNENSPNATVVGTVSATDPDAGQTLTYSITAGNTGGAFAINSSTGQITVAASAAVNFEVTPTFSLTVQAQDNGTGNLTGTATITINLTDVNDAPTIGNQTFAVPENSPNGTSVGNVAASDEDAGQTVTYAITAGNTGNVFAINPSTGQITVVGALNFEGPDDPYLLTVQVTDNAGVPASSSATITINLTDVNEAPILNDALRNINENSPNATLVGAVLPFTDEDIGQTYTFAITAGNTGGAFAINNAGQISVANVSQLNFEATPQFVLTVQITDNGTPNLSDTATVTIDINNLNEAPTAVADTYNALGGTSLHIAGTVAVPVTTVAQTGDVSSTPRTTGTKANDTDPDTVPAFNTLTITFVTGNAGAVAVPGTTTTVNGSVTLHADGSFIYTPNAGFIGSDSFTYTINDALNNVTGTVNLNVVGPAVRYVKNNVSVAGNGTSAAPHQTLAAAITASVANEIIYVMEGDGTATNYGGSNLMKAGQRLWGQGIDLDVTTTTAVPLPNLIVATNRPLIGPGGASETIRVVNVSGVDVQGLRIDGGTTNALDLTTSAANSGGVSFSGNIILTAGAEGIDVNAGGTGVHTIDIQNNTITSTGNGIDLLRTAGTVAVVVSNNLVTSASNSGIVINGGAVASTTITGFAGNTIHQSTGATGISVLNATFDPVAGAPFTTVTGGATNVGVFGDGVGGSGVVLSNVAGDLFFTTLNIYANNGTGLSASGLAAFNAAAGTGFRLVASSGTDTISATNGPAVNISTATITLTPSVITTTGSATFGVNLDAVAGTFSAGSGSSINTANAAATAFRVNGSSVSTTYSGPITVTAGTGISLTTNTGTYAFSGLLNFSTGTANAFHVTSSGTVSSSNTASTLTTTTGTALRVTGTTVAAAGLKFRSVTQNGGTNAIVLDGTGNTGGTIVVSGTGSAGTGGTIQNTSGDAISLNNAHNASFSWMNITNAASAVSNLTNCDLDTASGCESAVDLTGASSNITIDRFVIDHNDGGQTGISANAVNGLTITNTQILEVGNTNEESGILLVDPQGVVTITDVTVDDPAEYGIRVYKLAGTTLNMKLTRVLVQNNLAKTFGEAGFSIRADGGTSYVLVDDSDFLNTDGPGVDGQAINAAVLHMTVQNTVFTENRALPFAVNFTTDNTSQGFAKITGNTITDCVTPADCSIALDFDANRTSSLHAIVANNTINGSGIGSAMEFVVGDGATGRAEVRDNNVTVNGGEIGMTFHARSEGFGGANGRLDVIYEGNTVNGVSSGGLFNPGIQFLAGSSTGTHDQDVCVNTSLTNTAGGNTINGTNSPGLTPRFEVTQRTGTAFFLQGFTGTGTSDASVAAHFNSNNNAGNLDPTFVRPAGGTAIVNYVAAGCNSPTTPTLPTP